MLPGPPRLPRVVPAGTRGPDVGALASSSGGRGGHRGRDRDRSEHWAGHRSGHRGGDLGRGWDSGGPAGLSGTGLDRGRGLDHSGRRGHCRDLDRRTLHHCWRLDHRWSRGDGRSLDHHRGRSRGQDLHRSRDRATGYCCRVGVAQHGVASGCPVQHGAWTGAGGAAWVSWVEGVPGQAGKLEPVVWTGHMRLGCGTEPADTHPPQSGIT